MINNLSDLNNLFNLVCELRKLADGCYENDSILRLYGRYLNKKGYELIALIEDICSVLGHGARINVEDDNVSLIKKDDVNYIEGEDGLGKEWCLHIGKKDLLSNLVRDGNVVVMIFFFLDLFRDWTLQINPLERESIRNPFNEKVKTIIYVKGINAFGSGLLSVLPWFADDKECNSKFSLPEDEEIQEYLHIISKNHVQVSPLFFGLSWGDINQPYAYGMLVNSVKTLLCCLAHEIRVDDEQCYVVLKGLKKISSVLMEKNDEIDCQLNKLLIKVVSWVFEERIETRRQLLNDRLSIECDEHDSFVSCVKKKLSSVWEQAKDSYGFILLDRKDAHQKELREFMKDMRLQADLYAAKVRDLLSGLTRDFLAILLLIGLTLTKIDFQEAIKLLQRPEGILYIYILCAYLLISASLQIIINWRDVRLSYNECESWTEILRNYTHSEDIQKKFKGPIIVRKNTFYVALFVFAIIYLVFIITIFRLDKIVNYVGGQ